MSDAIQPLSAMAERIRRTVAIAVTAVLTAAVFAGLLPGASIFLGLLSADPLLTVARITLAVALLDGLRRSDSTLRVRLRWVGFTAGGFALVALADRHAFGLLPHGVMPPEVAVAAATSALCLTTSALDPTPRRNAW
ncbi:hypothetical protein [Microbacterium schleiferi]|uniref:hypothetical protein n=1 Tax=Microbacterium schleiferi TaxID=69362 RepID=UPI00312052A2